MTTVDEGYEQLFKEHQHSEVNVRTRRRERGYFGDFNDRQMSVKAARNLYVKLRGRNFNNTRAGDWVWISVGGTLSQIIAVYQSDYGKELVE